jgi:hypothetical protein
MQPRYRSDYAGEFVVLETRWAGGKKEQSREFVPNPIENHHISGRATCIGSSADLDRFDYRILQRHRGGLLGSKKLQNYGTGDIANKMRLDFVVETRPTHLQHLIDSKYHENNIVYTSAKNCVNNPGNFYLIPHNPSLIDLVTIVYLAAFDEHKEIFLLGYNRDTLIDRDDWYLQIQTIVNTYSGTKFYFVGEMTNMYTEWLDCANTQTMTYREFISCCDV